jgi:pimeloyl-ACP methyl ester carboxylesterase
MKTIITFFVVTFSLVSAYCQKLPYPIIFIHGLNSNSKVWDEQRDFLLSKNLTYGGRIDFSLNDDGNNSTSNKLLYPAIGADIALYTDYSTLLSGDFYRLNFDINNIGQLFPSDDGSGFNDMLSNESAIVKQGLALKYAIQMVLLKTGKDKVILMGHSMGGLCAREYLQNSSNWQADGQHHVAKLTTTGTPHGGYTGYGLSPTIDFRSEAYRDLKTSYVVSGDNGVYLFGGAENYATMNNNLIYNFYNVDVNCNGVDTDNSNIIGLNQKSLSSDVDYAYIVGICTNCQALQGNVEGDGIVRSENANLSNFYVLANPKNEFILTADASTPIGLHSDLPKAIPQNMQGLDEPNEYYLSYIINPTTVYQGFITQQPIGGYPYDYDDYKFTVASSGNIMVNFNNSYSQPVNVRIINSSGIQIATTTISAFSSGNLNQNLNAGQYFLEIYSTPSAISYQYPYSFSFTTNLSTENFTERSISLYPNPAKSKFFISSNDSFDNIEIFSSLGQKVLTTSEFIQGIDVSHLSSGMYFVRLYSGENVRTVQIVKE